MVTFLLGGTRAVRPADPRPSAFSAGRCLSGTRRREVASQRREKRGVAAIVSSESRSSSPSRFFATCDSSRSPTLLSSSSSSFSSLSSSTSSSSWSSSLSSSSSSSLSTCSSLSSSPSLPLLHSVVSGFRLCLLGVPVAPSPRVPLHGSSGVCAAPWGVCAARSPAFSATARRNLFSQRSAGLKIPRLSRVYTMTPRELRNAIADCARRQIRMKELWDAFLYRAVVLRAELRPEHIATIFRSLATVQKPVLSFVDYMLEDVRFRLHMFRLQDISLLLSALARLEVRDDLLLQALLPILLKRISPASPPKDFALVMHAFVRMQGPQIDLVGSRVVASLAGRVETLEQPQTIALLLFAFAEHAKKQVQREALEREVARASVEVETGEKHEGFAEKAQREGQGDRCRLADNEDKGETQREREGEREREQEEDRRIRIPFRMFIESLLEQTGKQLRGFRARDCVHTLAAVASLAECNRRIREEALQSEEDAACRDEEREREDDFEGGGKPRPDKGGSEAWDVGCLPPSLLEDVLWRVHKRLQEVKFELQSRDAVLLFRGVHTLQAECGEFTAQKEELIKQPRQLEAETASSEVSSDWKDKKKRRQPLLDRLKNLVVREVTHRAGDLEAMEALELLRILASENQQCHPGLEAALCVRLSDALASFSSPFYKPPVELHRALHQLSDVFLRLFSAAKPHFPPSFSPAASSSPAFSSNSPRISLASTQASCDGQLTNAPSVSSETGEGPECLRQPESVGRSYRFVGAISACFFKLLHKQREMKLTPQTAASVTWALGVFHIRDPHWASTLKHRRASVVSCFTSQCLLPSSCDASSSSSPSSSLSSSLCKPSFSSSSPSPSKDDASDTSSADASPFSVVSEEEDSLHAFLSGAQTLSKLANGLALLGMGDVADELGIFPLLSTVETFRDIELPLSILMAAAIFDLTRRPATLANSLLLPAAQAIYDQRTALPPSYYPSLRFISMSTLPSAWPAPLQNFYANPGASAAVSPAGPPSVSSCHWISPHISRVATHDMLLRTAFIQSEKLRKSSRGRGALVHQSQHFDAVVGRFLSKSRVASLLYKPWESVVWPGEAHAMQGGESGDSQQDAGRSRTRFREAAGDPAAEEDNEWGDEVTHEAETGSDADTGQGSVEEEDCLVVFPERVRKELMSWRGVGVSCEVPVGPFLVPFAVDLVSLGAHLKRFPLSATKASPRAEEEGQAEENEGAQREERSGQTKETKDEVRATGDGEEGGEEGTGTAKDAAGLSVLRSEEKNASAGKGETLAVSRKEFERGESCWTDHKDADDSGEDGVRTSEGTLKENVAHGEDSGDGTRPNPRTHVLLDLLWRDFDFYMEPHHASVPSSAPADAAAASHAANERNPDSHERDLSSPQRPPFPRNKSPMLCAGKFAELNALRRQGWHVACISETTWLALEEKQRRGEGTREDMKRYILSCIASLGKQKEKRSSASERETSANEGNGAETTGCKNPPPKL
uniref:RAP domain-containing protein n=1 Tax=Toxoplasma gondii COUG TaxID=1074873 RepID=A0A2G8YDH8_TOXGO|nr:hypothetical protein TGCOUG_260840 [Toxoplasma gondii COUG]